MKKLRFYFSLALLSYVAISFAQRGKDGNVTVNTVNHIVNEYTALTTDVSAGATTLNVASSGLNANNRFPGILAPGDLILIIQMQGATIYGQPDSAYPYFSNPDSAAWGSITNYNNCGNYELCQVAAVSDNSTIVIDCGLVKNYTTAGRTQVVRIPRYNTLTINSPGILTCQTWNGTTGGILAVEVKSNTLINAGGKINVSGKGFRGASLYVPSSPRTQIPWYASSIGNVSANKGEGIAGYDNDYTPYGGKFCRGAAANAGGAGNIWNCGGGGGANAGSVNSWTGQGNPDTTNTGWITAWNLESTGFAYTSSSGGGRGGYGFSGSDQNATVDPPNDLVWGGYARMNFGGLGGRPLDYSTGRIFMGGGGGGGEQDNNEGGAGGAGGGIIYFSSYGNITGSGNDSILAEGNSGGNAYVTPPLTSYSGKDGAGGGGGGGTILLNTFNAAGLILSAKGGKGGNQLLTSGALYFGAKNEAEGPGGGGGGGYIALSSGAVTQIASGGKNGTTNSDGLTEFPPNGATKGGNGLANQALPPVDTLSVSAVTICAGDSATLIATLNGTTPTGLVWYDAPTGGNLVGTDTFVTAALTNSTIYYAGLCPGNYRVPAVITVLSSTATINITSSPTGVICPGTAVTFAASTTNEGTSPAYQWLVNGQPAGTNAAAFTSSSLANSDSVTCMLIPGSGCSAGNTAVSDTIIMEVSPSLAAAVTIAASPATTICSGTSVTFTATSTNGGTAPVYQWQLNGINVGNDSAVYTNSFLNNGDVISCILTSNANCVTGSPASSNSVTMAVNALSVPVFISDINSGCHLPLCVQFTETSGNTYNTLVYDFGDGDTASTAIAQHCFSQVGNYSIALSATDSNNCTGTTVIGNMVVISPQPAAGFVVSPEEGITANSNVIFTNTSSNTSTSAWNFGDSLSVGNTSAVTSPSHIYTAAGIYCIDLVAYNQAGCADSVSQCITVTNESSIAIPNMFTPNGDGINDVFFVTVVAIKDLSCSIYDRWGLKIAEWNTIDGGWNGISKNGKAAQSGVYYYLIKATAVNGKEINEKGFLQLLRE